MKGMQTERLERIFFHCRVSRTRRLVGFCCGGLVDGTNDYWLYVDMCITTYLVVPETKTDKLLWYLVCNRYLLIYCVFERHSLLKNSLPKFSGRLNNL